MRTGSLTLRLFLLSSIWTIIAVAIITIVLSTGLRRFAETQFFDTLTAHLYNLMGSVDSNAATPLSGAPNLGDPRYFENRSGWYWLVQSTANARIALKSQSLGALTMPAYDPSTAGNNFLRTFFITGPHGEPVAGVEAVVFLGEGDRLFRFVVTGHRALVEAEIRKFRRLMIIYLGCFGAGLVVVGYFVVHFGLRPLRAATEALDQISKGKADKLEGRFPSEIAPLIDGINSLIASNQRVIVRARTQVGNLAHALKTPISVILNETSAGGTAKERLISQQTEQMRGFVQRYLDRARVAANVGVVSSSTRVKPLVERLVRVLDKLHHERVLTLDFAADLGLLFQGEQEDFEELLGNLLENACKWAKEKIVVTVTGPNGAGKSATFTIVIDDDGPGMAKDQFKEARKRGRRLDETAPGSGLGLSIVDEIATEYGGCFELARSPLGGLRASITLPAA